jgi:hypothetical protein
VGRHRARTVGHERVGDDTDCQSDGQLPPQSLFPRVAHDALLILLELFCELLMPAGGTKTYLQVIVTESNAPPPGSRDESAKHS